MTDVQVGDVIRYVNKEAPYPSLTNYCSRNFMTLGDTITVDSIDPNTGMIRNNGLKYSMDPSHFELVSRPDSPKPKFQFQPRMGMLTRNCYLHGIGQHENIGSNRVIEYVGVDYFVLRDMKWNKPILVLQSEYGYIEEDDFFIKNNNQ
jgi:hypothetical protein